MTKSKLNWDDAQLLDEAAMGIGAAIRGTVALAESFGPLSSMQQLLHDETQRTIHEALIKICRVARGCDVVLPRINTTIREFSPETKAELGLTDEHEWEKAVDADYDRVNADIRKRRNQPPTAGGHEV